MEKARPWCGQPSDRGRLRNRTERDEVTEWSRKRMVLKNCICRTSVVDQPVVYVVLLSCIDTIQPLVQLVVSCTLGVIHVLLKPVT